MRILITGVCGFVGSTLAIEYKKLHSDIEIFGIDNFSRSGSWLNKDKLQKLGIKIFTGDIRSASDLECIPKCDWVIDAAANASVLAGVDGMSSSRQLVENNLQGTINLLEYCKKHKAGFILLSTSRVYSIPGIAELQLLEENGAFKADPNQEFPKGISVNGISEEYSTQPPVSLYGSTKVTSEHLALEYGYTFDFPVWINRCGVMAGAGQFGHPAQGIFAFWIHSFREQNPLKYIGFGGHGYQVRDCLHPRDLIPLFKKQMTESLNSDKPRIINLSGGITNTMSLLQLSQWCQENIGVNTVKETNIERPFDIGWMVLDHTLATNVWGWSPSNTLLNICDEIASFSLDQTNWLQVSI